MNCSRCGAPLNQREGSWCRECHKIVRAEMAARFPEHIAPEDEPLHEHQTASSLFFDNSTEARKLELYARERNHPTPATAEFANTNKRGFLTPRQVAKLKDQSC